MFCPVFLSVVGSLQAIEAIGLTAEEHAAVVQALNELDKCPSATFLNLMAAERKDLEADLVWRLMPRPLAECNVNLLYETMRRVNLLNERQMLTLLVSRDIPYEKVQKPKLRIGDIDKWSDDQEKLTMTVAARFAFPPEQTPIWHVSKDGCIQVRVSAGRPALRGAVINPLSLYKEAIRQKLPRRVIDFGDTARHIRCAEGHIAL